MPRKRSSTTLQKLLFLQLKLLRLLRLLLQCLLHAFALWDPFGEHPPSRIGAPDRRQFLGTIKWQLSRSTQNLTFVWHIFCFFLEACRSTMQEAIKSHQIPSNHIKSPHIITYHFISNHIITYPHYKIRDCCFCSWSCWGCFYSAFACLCLVGSFWRAPPLIELEPLIEGAKCHIPTVSCLFCPRRGFAPGLAPERQSESKDMWLLHGEQITQRRFYTQKPLHREGFTQSSFYINAFAHRRFYIQELLHRKAFFERSLTTWSLYTEQLYTQTLFTKKFLHTGTFTRRCPRFYTQELLHTHTRLTKRSF